MPRFMIYYDDMTKYIDAHCHLANNTALSGILAHAQETNVVQFINNSAKFSDWGNVIEISQKNPDTVGTIGIHPWYISDVPKNWSEVMQDLLLQNSQIQVGEIGLDKKHTDIDKQIDIFIQQSQIAHNLGRGISVHIIGMWDKLFEILKTYENKLPKYIILHSYNGPYQNMDKISEKYNLYFSFSPRNITSKKCAQHLKELPITRILVESDTDNPVLVINVIDNMVKILNIEHNVLADIIYNNTKRILNNGQAL